jgi:hypothetical protein
VRLALLALGALSGPPFVAPRRAQQPHSPLGVGSAVNCSRTTTLEPDFGFLPTTRDTTRCWLGSVDSAHEAGVVISGQRTCQPTVTGRPSARFRPGSDTFPSIGTILDMPAIVRVEVGSLVAAQHDLGVCDAIHADAPRIADEKR